MIEKASKQRTIYIPNPLSTSILHLNSRPNKRYYKSLFSKWIIQSEYQLKPQDKFTI